MTIQRKRVAKRLASGLLAGALALGGLAISGGSVSAKTPSSPSTNRLSGEDRYETAVAVARDYVSTVGQNGLVVASGESPYDALAASALAGFIDAPIILVKSDSVPSSVLDFITDNISNFRSAVAKKIYFVGGTSAIGDDVVTAVMDAATAGDATPIGSQRISGEDRYATAAAIANFPGLMTASKTMIIANGANDRWADALSVGSVAAENKWPIILTGNGGLNDTAKAQIDAYLAMSGSAKKFLLVGGEAVLPTSVTDYLIGKNVKPETIYRRGGMDRYDTNVLINNSTITSGGVLVSSTLLTNILTGVGKVALVSGASPWDALTAGPWAAKKGMHVVISSLSPSPYTVGLVGALSAVYSGPKELWIVGGRTVVPNALRDAVIATAQGAADTTSTLTGCDAGRTSAVFTVVGGNASVAETEAVTVSASPYFTSNGVKDTVTDFVSTFTDIGTKANGSSRTYTTYQVTFGRKLIAGETVAFSGVNEITPGGVVARSIAGSSCVVAADATAPTATIVPRTDGANLNSIYVSLSEPIVNDGGTAQTSTNASLSAATYWSFDSTWSTQKTATLSATNLDSSYTKYLVTVEGAISVASLATVSLEKEAVVDQAGNTMAADVSATALADATAPTFTLGTVTCNANSSGQASFTAGNLTLAAVAGSSGGSEDGRKGNRFKLSVVNQRGLLIPSIAVDGTAGTITVIADTGYHTVADLSTVMDNTGVSGNWSASGSGALSATLVPASSTAGKDDCKATVTYNEPADATASESLTVNGVVVSSGVSGYNTAHKTSFTLRFPATVPGAAPVSLSMTTENSLGITDTESAATALP